MNKKALTQEQITKGFMVAAVIVIVISIFYTPAGSLFARIFGINLTKFVQIGGNEVPKLETALPEDIQTVYDNLLTAFKQKGSDCLIAIPAIKADFSNYKINFQSAPDGTWILVNKVEKGREVEVKSEKVDNVKACAIAGASANLFYNTKIKSVLDFNSCFNELLAKKIDASEARRRCTFSYPISASDFIQQQNLFLTANEKLSQWSLNDAGLKYAGREVDLLFKPTEDLVCFFPTFRGFFDVLGRCSASNSGLNNDCMKDLLPGGKFNPVDSQGKPAIPFCSGEEVLCNIYKRCSDITNLDVCRSIGDKCELKCQINAATQQYCEEYNPLGIPQ